MKKKDYNLARKRISEILAREDIISAYEYGSYKNPGLSDIDLIIVIKNRKISNIKTIIRHLKQNELRFFFEYSTIMVTVEPFLKNILLFDDLSIKKISGKNIKLKKFNKIKNFLLILSILEWLPERTLRLKENIINFEKVLLRKHLGLLNSIKFTLSKINYYINDARINTYSKEIDQLRANKDILRQRKKILFFSKKILVFLKYLIHQIPNKPFVKNLKIRVDGTFRIKFPNGYKIVFTRKKSIKNVKKSIVCSSIYSIPFAFHTKYNNSVFNLMKSHILLSKDFKININEKKINFILNGRNKLLNENIKLLKKNSLNKGLYKLGWFLRDEKKNRKIN